MAAPTAAHKNILSRLNATHKNVREAFETAHKRAVNEYEDILNEENELQKVVDEIQAELKSSKVNIKEVSSLVEDVERAFLKVQEKKVAAEKQVKEKWEAYMRYDKQARQRETARAWEQQRWANYQKWKQGRGGGRRTRRVAKG